MGRSTTTAGIKFVQEIINAIDKKENAVGIFLDISKAFDSVSHKQLLDVLDSLGIKGKELRWFQSYLSNRSQFVEIKHRFHDRFQNHRSSLSQIDFGVPQGSILGPLLFVCYLTGLPTLCGNNAVSMVLYADDANILFTGKNQTEIEEIASTELSKIKQFLNNSNLLLNTGKTNCISFHTRQTEVQ